jgi:succinate-semialdehyde dehydrogenase/glutarate-semialdehyde dehydrogenase
MVVYPDLYMVIAGERVAGAGRRLQPVLNPATGEIIGQLPLADPADLDRALDATARGFKLWRESTPHQRASVLLGAAHLLHERAETLAGIATLEEGKTLAEARIELHAVAGLFQFYAGEAYRTYGRGLVRPAGLRSTVIKEPVGPVAAFSPWNFPLGNPGRKLGAPIAAGCSVILKSAEETPASALGILQALYDAGLPADVAQAVFGIPDEVSRHLLASPIIRKLSFTGSTTVGKHLMRLAADDVKRTTMELGGHGPVLIFADADIDAALNMVVGGKMRNAGQVCIAPTRFIVEESVFDKFADGFVARAAAVTVGDGFDPDVQMGPMANARRPLAMEHLVADALAHGAKMPIGGARIGARGFFFAPTVLTDVPQSSIIMNDEPFGPVAIINRFADENAMLTEANRLPYGLAAYAWTQDRKRSLRLGHALEAGMIGINTSMVAAADSPFGGVKWSGHGSENAIEGIEACLITKAVHEA